MLRATLRGLAERKLRFALCVAAIVLGCALAGGTGVLGSTVDQAFDRLFADRNAGVDILVRSAPAFAGQSGGFASRGQVPVDAVDVVEAVPGVAAAAGTRFGVAQLIDKQGHPIKSEGPPTLGVEWVDDARLNQFTLVDGTPPRPGGVVIDLGRRRRLVPGHTRGQAARGRGPRRNRLVATSSARGRPVLSAAAAWPERARPRDRPPPRWRRRSPMPN